MLRKKLDNHQMSLIFEHTLERLRRAPNDSSLTNTVIELTTHKTGQLRSNRNEYRLSANTPANLIS